MDKCKKLQIVSAVLVHLKSPDYELIKVIKHSPLLHVTGTRIQSFFDSILNKKNRTQKRNQHSTPATPLKLLPKLYNKNYLIFWYRFGFVLCFPFFLFYPFFFKSETEKWTSKKKKYDPMQYNFKNVLTIDTWLNLFRNHHDCFNRKAFRWLWLGFQNVTYRKRIMHFTY